MPRPSIEYLNARKAAKAASGGTNYANESDAERKRRIADELERDRDADGYDIARNAIGAFSLWAETSLEALRNKLGHPAYMPDQIPF